MLRYLKGDIVVGIFYKKKGCTYPMAYADNDFVDDLDGRRSTLGSR